MAPGQASKPTTKRRYENDVLAGAAGRAERPEL